jgi:putative redox protein
MTLRMYADRKGIELDHISVKLKHGRVHGKDCEECERQDGFVDVIERDITLRGNLDEAIGKRMLEIADRCPVHRTLHNEILVKSKLVEE